MKRNTAIILALINITLTAIVWLKWGGIGNGIGTIALVAWLFLSLNALHENVKKPAKK